MAADFPKSFKDPLYASLDAGTEQKLGLPVGLLSSVRTHGERSNHDAVSSAGATTVYQFTPATRKAILNKYGIDVTLSPQNASEGAGLLLKEGLDRNQGDLAAAVGEYVGGLDRKEWGNVTKSYVNRVMVGQKQAKDTALDNAFSQWMAANPAVPAGRDASAIPTQQPAKPAEDKPDPLADAFGKWLDSSKALPSQAIDAYAAGTLPPEEMQRIKAGVADGSIKLPPGVSLGNTSAVGRIPGIDPNVQLSQPAPEPSLGDKVIGTGEMLASLGTGMVGGTVGMAGGMVKGMAQAILDGSYGTKQAADMVEQEAMKGADALTYHPRTDAGQQITDAAGKIMAESVPVAAILHTLPPVMMGARGAPAAVMARAGVEGTARDAANLAAKPAEAAGIVAPGAAGDAAAAGAAATTDAALSGAQRVASMAKGASTLPSRALAAIKGESEQAPTPGTMASGGAAGTDLATQRRATAESLPVPIEITKGQAERSFEQQRFEQETAKDPYAGAPLRERFADQNQKILENFDNLIDKTGAEAPSLRAVGASVDSALVQQAAKDKAAVRVAYKNAEKAGEMEQPVSLDSVVQHINDSGPEAATAPLLTVAKNKAIQTGIAEIGPDGTLVAKPVSLKTAEEFRKSIGAATDFTPTNVRQATIIKGLVDEATDGMGGDLYRQARALRARYAQNYEDRAAISKLLNNKRGTSDRQVALEDVFNHTMLNSSMDDVRNIRRVLQRSGSQGEQAWRDLQGQTMQWIKDQATKNVATDIRGNQIVSAAALDKAIKTLDHDGKLDFIFGKKGAQTVREINDISKVVHTSPPGSVNTSNTASVLLAALSEASLTGALTGLPVPVLTGLKGLATYAKQRRLQAKVQEALGNKPKQPKPNLKVVPKTTPSGKPMH